MRYIILSTVQLCILAILMSILTSTIICINSMYQEYKKLPLVRLDTSGACVSVENFENGHAFNCNDVNVLLRRYRSTTK